MKQDPRDLILRILEIIDYPGNRLKFAKKMIALCHFKACWSLVERLSDEDQEKIKKKVDKNITPVALKIHLMQWYGAEEYSQALEEASNRLFEDFFSKIVSKLSPEKKVEVKALI